MSVDHNGGNIQNAIIVEEHIGELNAKRVGLVSAATIYAVVNTSAAGVGQSMVTINSGPNQIGSVTISNSIGILGNITLSASPNFIGLVTVANTVPVSFSNVTINGGPNQIGSVTVSNPITLNSVVTLSPSVNSIGFATVNLVNQPALVASSAYIGLASVNIGGTLPALSAGVAGIGFATVNLVNQPALVASAAYIGLVSVSGSVVNLTGTNNIGSVSILGGMVGMSGNMTLSDSKTYIGLTTTTLGVGTQFIGLVTAWISSLPQLSFYQQASLASGYKFYGNAAPGSNPTTANFKIQREALDTGEVLFADGSTAFNHVWSAASLSSIIYS